MFVVVNIARLEIEFALLDDNGKIQSRFSISTQNKKTDDQYTTEIKNVFEYLKIKKENITNAVILSTIAKFNHIVNDFFQKYVRIDPIIINIEDIPFECSKNINSINIPIDVFCGTYACNKIYGSNVIFINFDNIISFGVCVDNSFIGYVIYPGFDILSTSIHEQISEYPEIVIKQTTESYAFDRYNALNVGVFNGSMGAIDNIINNIKNEYENKQFTIVATCRNPELLQYSKTINIIDQDLMIKSIVEAAKNKMFAV